MKHNADVLAERILAILVLAGIAAGCWLVLEPFLSAIFWAGILAFTTWPVFNWLRYRLHMRDRAAAGVMVLLTAVLIVLPLGLAAPAGADDVNLLRSAVEDALSAGLPSSPPWLYGVPVVGPTLSEYWNLWAADLSGLVDAFKPYFGMIAESALKLLVSIAGGLLQFLLALVVAFFFYASGDTLARFLRRLAHRIAGDRASRLVAITGATVRGAVYGILGTALVQGLLTMFGLWISGVPRPLLLGAIAGLIAVLPIGAPVVWIPAAIWLLGSGHTGWGIFLGAYGLLIVSGSDNVIRPWFIARGAQLPFLLTILGVLGGALAFGLLGIFLGPVLLGVGFTLAAEFADPDSVIAEPSEPEDPVLPDPEPPYDVKPVARVPADDGGSGI